MRHCFINSNLYNFNFSYYEHIAELYFLETSGNMLDYYTWRKKPRTNHYMSYLTKHQLDASDLSQEDTPTPQQAATATTASRLASPRPETSVGSVSTTQSVVLAAPITSSGKFWLFQYFHMYLYFFNVDCVPIAFANLYIN